MLGQIVLIPQYPNSTIFSGILVFLPRRASEKISFLLYSSLSQTLISRYDVHCTVNGGRHSRVSHALFQIIISFASYICISFSFHIHNKLLHFRAKQAKQFVLRLWLLRVAYFHFSFASNRIVGISLWYDCIYNTISKCLV